MSFEDLIKRFTEMQWEKSFTPSQYKLYIVLLNYNNDLYWKDEFEFPAYYRDKMVGLSKQGFIDARNELIERGLIKYKPRTGGQSGLYTIVDRPEIINEEEFNALMNSDC